MFQHIILLDNHNNINLYGDNLKVNVILTSNKHMYSNYEQFLVAHSL